MNTLKCKNAIGAYNLGLDVLRIFSMAAVLLVHLGQTAFFPKVLVRFTVWGQYGVHIFFVLSGYLAAQTYLREERIITYYKKRAIRILPTYYLAIIFAIVANIAMGNSLPKDPFHLGWIRYFLGLNMILPSNDYQVWNNAYGWWTMGTFIGFYILVPLLFKFIDSFKKALISIPVTFTISIVSRYIYVFVFHTESFDNVYVTIAGGIFGTLVQFTIGICVYFSVKENKIGECLLLNGLILVCAFILQKDNFLWCAIAGIFIVSAQLIVTENVSSRVRVIIKSASQQSYYIYLVHVIVIQILNRIELFEDSVIGSALYFLVFTVLVLVLSFILKICDELIKGKRFIPVLSNPVSR